MNRLNPTEVSNSSEYPKAKDALKWAALTYVVAVLAAVVTLVQYIMLYMGGETENETAFKKNLSASNQLDFLLFNGCIFM